MSWIYGMNPRAEEEIMNAARELAASKQADLSASWYEAAMPAILACIIGAIIHAVVTNYREGDATMTNKVKIFTSHFAPTITKEVKIFITLCIAIPLDYLLVIKPFYKPYQFTYVWNFFGSFDPIISVIGMVALIAMTFLLFPFAFRVAAQIGQRE